MYDRSLLLELLLEIEEAIRRIEWRFEGVESVEDFTLSTNGLDRLDGISMMLIVISENIRRIQKLVGDNFFEAYPEVSWSDVKGIRNILSHTYFDIDPDEIYGICANEIDVLKQVLIRIRNDLFQ